MEIQGYIRNGQIVPQQPLGLPDGAEVTILVPARADAASQAMTPEQLVRYREAWAQIDSLPNENPGDGFSGANHDQVLYGDGQ